MTLGVLLGAAVLLLPEHSAAQEELRPDAGATAPGQHRQQAALAYFAAAMEHYRARRFREAIHDFQLSIAELPSADVWFNIGRAHEQLGEYALAVEHYRLYLRDRVEAPDAAEVQQRIAALERRSVAHGSGQQPVSVDGSLAIEAPQSGALLLLDGEKLGVSPIERVLHVTPGRHRLDVSRPGHIPFRADVEVQPGALSMAYVELRPQRQPSERRSERLWTWVAAGASACALLTSGALGIVALDRRDAGAWRDARRAAVASDIALGAGIGLAIGAAVLYFVEGAADESTPESARSSD